MKERWNQKKMMLCMGIFFLCLVAGFFFPDVWFSFIDKQELDHVKVQTVEESNVILFKKASMSERLQMFQSEKETIDTVMNEGEKKNVLQTAKEELRVFFEPLGYDIFTKEPSYSEVIKQIYSSEKEEIHSFLAYLIKLEYEECEIELVLDMESQRLLFINLDASKVLQNDLIKEKSQWMDVKNQDFYDLLLEFNDIKNSEEKLIYLLSCYYSEFQIKMGGSTVYVESVPGNLSEFDSEISDKKQSMVSGGGKVSSKNNYLYVFSFMNDAQTIIDYQVKVSHNQIIFNDRCSFDA